MEIVTVLLFTLALIGCISSGHSIIYALIFGLFLFISYPVYLKYRPKEILEMLLNGGITSMLRVMAIVGISSAYAGIFQKTGLLQKFSSSLAKLSTHTNSFFALFLTAFVTSAIACNQTLAIMLSFQLCNDLENDKQKLALALENSVVVIAPLIPWAIASAVPLASIGAPISSILCAFFLYLLPLCTLFKYSSAQIFRPKSVCTKKL